MSGTRDADAAEKGRVLSNYEAFEILKNIQKNTRQADHLRADFDAALKYAGDFKQYSDGYALKMARDSIRRVMRNSDGIEQSEAAMSERRRQEAYDEAAILNLSPRSVSGVRAYARSMDRRSNDEINHLIEKLDELRQ